MEDLKLIAIRPMRPSDIPYIYDTWMQDFLSAHHMELNSFKNPDRKFKKQVSVALMPKQIYYKEQRALIDKIIAKSKVTVICNEEDEDQIFGYVVHRHIGLDLGVVSWMYVRPVYRGMGLAKKLMAHIGEHLVMTHVTPKNKWFLSRFNLIFNPYMEFNND